MEEQLIEITEQLKAVLQTLEALAKEGATKKQTLPDWAIPRNENDTHNTRAR